MKKRMSFRLWFPLAFALFLAPIAIFSFVFNANVEKNEALYTNQVKWEQFMKASTSIINMFSRCSIAVEDTTSIQDCFYVENNNVSALDSNLALLLEKIEARINGVECICSVRGNTDIYTSRGRMSFREYEAGKNAYDLTKSQFCSRIHATKADHLKTIYSVDGSIDNGLVLFVPVSIRPVANHDVIFVFWMDASKIAGFLNEYMGNINGNFFLYNQQKVECFLSLGDLPLSYWDILKINGNGILKASVHHEPHVAIRYTDSQWGLVFTLIETEKDFYQSVFDNSNTRSLMLGGAMLFLLAAAILLSLILYQPIKKLYISITQSQQAKLHENEFDTIMQTYERSKIEREHLENRVSNLGQDLTNQFLLKLLFGTFSTSEQVMTRSAELGLIWHHSKFCVLYLLTPYKHNMDLPFLKEKRRLSDSEVLPCEIWQENSICWMINTSAADSARRAMEIADGLKEELTRCGVSGFQIGVGRCYDCILQLADSYIEASVAAKLTNSAQSAVSSFEEHYDQASQQSSSFRFQTGLSLLQEALRYSDSSVANRITMELIEHFSDISSSFLMFRFNVSRLVSVLQDQSVRNGKPLTNEELHPLLMFQSKSEFIAAVQKTIDELCIATSKRDEENEQLLRNRVMAYARENFMHFDFCLDQLTATFNISSSRASNIFQETTGLSFAKYIARLRLEEFKRLLSCTNQTIGDCVKAVGYTDVPSFLRKFKALEGMTPTQYRQQQSENQCS